MGERGGDQNLENCYSLFLQSLTGNIKSLSCTVAPFKSFVIAFANTIINIAVIFAMVLMLYPENTVNDYMEKLNGKCFNGDHRNYVHVASYITR